MTEEEIRVASAEKLAQERAALPTSTETTPAEITPIIQRFAETLSDVAAIEIPVVDDEHGRYGWCSDGVRLKVATDGGEPVFGWTIWEWPPVLLTAEFHCVWRSDDGDLLDITPKPQRERSIVFVEDPSRPADFDFDHRPRNARLRTYQPEDRLKLVEELKQNLSGGRRRYEESRAAKAGVALDEWLDRKIDVDPLPAAVDSFISVCTEFEEHFDTLGSSGLVRVDERFMRLAKRRMEGQARLKALIRFASRRQATGSRDGRGDRR